MPYIPYACPLLIIDTSIENGTLFQVPVETIVPPTSTYHVPEEYVEVVTV